MPRTIYTRIANRRTCCNVAAKAVNFDSSFTRLAASMFHTLDVIHAASPSAKDYSCLRAYYTLQILTLLSDGCPSTTLARQFLRGVVELWKVRKGFVSKLDGTMHKPSTSRASYTHSFNPELPN